MHPERTKRRTESARKRRRATVTYPFHARGSGHHRGWRPDFQQTLVTVAGPCRTHTGFAFDLLARNGSEAPAVTYSVVAPASVANDSASKKPRIPRPVCCR